MKFKAGVPARQVVHFPAQQDIFEEGERVWLRVREIRARAAHYEAIEPETWVVYHALPIRMKMHPHFRLSPASVSLQTRTRAVRP